MKMRYAVVDIETTGGFAAGNGITEISILIHDGEQVVERYDTLINPLQQIPAYIEALTGITNDMVQHAPVFSEVASEIYRLLHDKVFVAHNVNFDYSFIRYQLGRCGYQLQCKKLCTVRLSRKLYPGFPSYSLGKLCGCLNITITDRHRAGGDATATAILFGLLIGRDSEGEILRALNRSSKEQALPPHLSKEQVDKLPGDPGVYYFKDQKGKVVYVGKAKNLKKRVCSHFSGNNTSRQRQDFLKSIYHVDFEVCATELMAFILEAAEIKRLWPSNNRAMKRFEQKYGIYSFEDQNGYLRLGIDKSNKTNKALFTFNSLLDGHTLLRNLIESNRLCEKLCFIQKGVGCCKGYPDQKCLGACCGEEGAEEYNIRVSEAINQLSSYQPTFALIDKGRSEDEKSCLWVEKGQFYGMGYISDYSDIKDVDSLKSILNPYPSNDYVLNMIMSHVAQYPEKKLVL